MARYWRAIGLDTHGGGDLDLPEIQLWNAGSQVDSAITITCVFTPVAGSLSGLCDGSVSTDAVFNRAQYSSPGFALEWDFGSSQSCDAFKSASGATKAESLERVQFQTSSDKTDWTNVFEVKGLLFTTANTLSNEAPGVGVDSTNLRTLLTGDGTLADPTGRTWTPAGSFGYSVAIHRPGYAAAIEFAGNGTASTPHTSDLNLSSGDFRIRFWYTPTNLPSIGAPFDYLVSKGTTSYGLFLYTGGLIYFRNNLTDLVTPAAHGMTIGNMYFIEAGRSGSNYYLSVNGVIKTSSTSGTIVDNSSGLWIGSYAATDHFSTGVMQDFYIQGDAPNTSNFSPPTNPAGYDTTVSEIPARKTILQSVPLIFASAPVDDQVLARLYSRIFKFRDIEIGGSGVLTGTVKIKGDPSDDDVPNIPVRRKVRLYRDIDGLLVAETWSDAVTGAWTFTGLNLVYRYTAIAYDYNHSYRAVPADNVAAEIA